MNNNLILKAFREMQPRDCDAWMLQSEAMRNQLERQIIMFPAYALPCINQPTTICGLIHDHGVGEIWMVTGKGFERSAPIVLQQQRQLLKTFYQVLNLHRLHMLVDSSDGPAKLWAARLGFVFEAGPLRGMGARGNDQDFYLYNPIAERSLT